MATILFGGSAANPPTLAGHGSVLQAIAGYSRLYQCVKKVVWIPSGSRGDKHLLPAELRRRMIEMTFPEEWLLSQGVSIEIDWRDIDGKNTPTVDIFHEAFRMYPNDDIVWYTGADSVAPIRKYGGRSEIQAKWKRGNELWLNPYYRFIILPRQGWKHPRDLELPFGHFSWINAELPDVSSSEVRRMVRSGEAVPEGWLAPGVEEMLKLYYSMCEEG